MKFASVTPTVIRSRVNSMMQKCIVQSNFTYEGTVRAFRDWMYKQELTREERLIVVKQVEKIFFDMERRVRILRQQIYSEVFNPFGGGENGNREGTTEKGIEGQSEQPAGSVQRASVRAGRTKRNQHGRSR